MLGNIFTSLFINMASIIFYGPALSLIVTTHHRVGREIVGGSRIAYIALSLSLYGQLFHSHIMPYYVAVYVMSAVFQSVCRWRDRQRGILVHSKDCGFWVFQYLRFTPRWLKEGRVLDVVIEPLLWFLLARELFGHFDPAFAFMIGWASLTLVTMQWGKHAEESKRRMDAQDRIAIGIKQAEIEADQRRRHVATTAQQCAALPIDGYDDLADLTARNHRQAEPKTNPVLDVFASIKDTMTTSREIHAEKRRTMEAVKGTVEAVNATVGTVKDTVHAVHQAARTFEGTAHAVTQATDAISMIRARLISEARPVTSDITDVIEGEWSSAEAPERHMQLPAPPGSLSEVA